jgi:hypothetical protein
MDINKNSISYNDYVKGINSLSIDEKLYLVKVLSSAIQKSSRKKKQNKILWNLKDWVLRYGKRLMLRNMLKERVMGLAD